nr:hypothetical protein [Tanacetum cinerariifolium]
MHGVSFHLVMEVLDEASLLWLSIYEENLDLDEQNVKQYERKICDGHYPVKLKILSSFSFGVTPYNYATLENLKGKHPFKLAPSFSHIHIDHHHLIASHVVVLNMIKCFPRDTSCGRDELRAQHLMDYLSGVVVAMSADIVGSITQVVNIFFMGNAKKVGEYIASALLLLLVNPVGGICPIVMGIDWRHLVSKVSVDMIDHFFGWLLNVHSLVLGYRYEGRLYFMS